MKFLDDLSSNDESSFDLLGIVDGARWRKMKRKRKVMNKKFLMMLKWKAMVLEIDVNPNYLMSFELNNIDNIDIGIISDTNNYLEGKDLDKCLINNE